MQGEEFIHQIIVVDDGSEDNTREVVQAFATTTPTVSIRLEVNPKKGACAARNYAFSIATGEAIQWLDADDLLGPGKLQAQLDLLQQNPGHLIATKWRRFTKNLDELFPEESGAWAQVPMQSTPLEWLSSERMMIPAGWLGTRILFQKVGGWDESLLINQDGEYFTRAIANSRGVLYEPTTRVYYRSGNTTSVSHFQADKAPSLFASCESFERTVLNLGNPDDVRTLISNKYMDFIYRVYPLVPELRKTARQKIRQYGDPTLTNVVAEGTLAKFICILFGWKTLICLRLLKTKILGK
jgi:glycosyltransferase involved in cell wall biosynthesis